VKLPTIVLLSLLAAPASALQSAKPGRAEPQQHGGAQAEELRAQSHSHDKTAARKGSGPRPEPPKLESVLRDGVKPLSRVGRVFLAGQPSAAALEALIAEGVDRVIDLRSTRESRGFDEPTRTQALGAKYVSVPFGDSVPLTDAILDKVRGALRRYRGKGKGKLLLHCGGSTRVGAVWLASRVLDEDVPYEVALDEAHRAGLRTPKYEEYARLYILGGGNHDLGEWIVKIRKKFPGVKGISVQTLARVWEAKKEDSDSEKPLLIDVRKPSEYEVSHIKGAKNADSVAAVRKLLWNVQKDREIVVYCSIGYRSADMAWDLAKMGYTKVRNLEGSIFEWANTGHPVFRGEERVNEVHPFDKEWGKLLSRELWADSAKW